MEVLFVHELCDRYNQTRITFMVPSMRTQLVQLTYEVELQPGEQLALPPELSASVGEGRWLVTIQPLPLSSDPSPVRNHNAFLNSYASEDEGLYDDYIR
jgi:D-lyxose ketol-isomerase